jgi:hypothetical protein
MSEVAPINLHFEDSGQWYSLPQWAEYFIRIGKQHASVTGAGSRLVTAIVVPTRAFGAAFVSLGMVINNAAQHDRISASAHFERLFDLPPETPVIYRLSNGAALKGLLQTPIESDGKLWVRIQVHSQAGGGLTYWIGESQCLKVQPTGGSAWKLPKTQGRDNIRTASKFVDTLLGEVDAVQFGLRSTFACALVGRRNVLEHEIRKTPLAIHVNGDPHVEGKLQDILRVDKFVGPQQSHRSALVSIGADPPSTDVLNNVEMGVVFDGAAGFLKWGTMWQSQHQVVILDRTEPYFGDAINAINTRFSQNSVHDGAEMAVVQAPPGGEILAFREALP